MDRTADDRRTRLAATGVVAILVALCFAGRADAATYTVWSCRGPDGAPVATSAWRADPAASGAKDTCAAGGALTAAASGEGFATDGWRFLLPPGAIIAGYRIHLTARTPKTDIPVEAGLVSDTVLSTGPVDAGCAVPGCGFGDPGEPLSPKNLVTREKPSSGLVLVARCAERGCALDGQDRPEASIQRAEIEIADPAAPVVGEPSGSLLAPAGVRGRAAVGSVVRDAGGGVRAVTLLIDGAPAGELDPGGDCATPYTVPSPCPAAVPAVFEVDTSALAPGAHTLEVRARDAADQAASSGPRAFTVLGPEPAAPGPGPGSGAQSGAAGSGAGETTPAILMRATVALDRTRYTLPARGRRITGVARRADGAPAAGARLLVRSRRFGGGAGARVERTLAAGPDGRFGFPVGSNPRRLVVELDDDAYREARSEEALVYGPLGLEVAVADRTLRNGARMTLRAAITGAGRGAAGGRTLLVQAIVGGRWTTVDDIDASSAGTGRWTYRFRRTSRAAVYRFRLVLRGPADDWPWRTTTSDAVRVRVSP